jgi:hypothetical protein
LAVVGVGVAQRFEIGDLVGLDTGQRVGLEFCQDAAAAAVRMVFGLKFLRREVLKACPLAKASTVKKRQRWTAAQARKILTEHSEPYNR